MTRPCPWCCDYRTTPDEPDGQPVDHDGRPVTLFADLVERMSPGPYVELFARQPRLGWDHWGYGYEVVA